MLLISLFIRSNWKIFAILLAASLVFYSGYHFRTLRYEAEKAKELTRQAEEAYKASANLENKVEQINTDTQKINQQLKMTYAENGNRCSIPASGLRLLKAANK